jgi:hypothetical protein
MDGAVNPASIAASISIGTSLLAGFGGVSVCVLVAMRTRDGAAANRDRAVSILFGVAILLLLLNAIAATLIAVGGMAYAGLVKATLLLTAAFAIVGMAFGLARGLRSGIAIKNPGRAKRAL